MFGVGVNEQRIEPITTDLDRIGVRDFLGLIGKQSPGTVLKVQVQRPTYLLWPTVSLLSDGKKIVKDVIEKKLSVLPEEIGSRYVGSIDSLCNATAASVLRERAESGELRDATFLRLVIEFGIEFQRAETTTYKDVAIGFYTQPIRVKELVRCASQILGCEVDDAYKFLKACNDEITLQIANFNKSGRSSFSQSAWSWYRRLFANTPESLTIDEGLLARVKTLSPVIDKLEGGVGYLDPPSVGDQECYLPGRLKITNAVVSIDRVQVSFSSLELNADGRSALLTLNDDAGYGKAHPLFITTDSGFRWCVPCKSLVFTDIVGKYAICRVANEPPASDDCYRLFDLVDHKEIQFPERRVRFVKRVGEVIVVYDANNHNAAYHLSAMGVNSIVDWGQQHVSVTDVHTRLVAVTTSSVVEEGDTQTALYDIHQGKIVVRDIASFKPIPWGANYTDPQAFNYLAGSTGGVWQELRSLRLNSEVAGNSDSTPKISVIHEAAMLLPASSDQESGHVLLALRSNEDGGCMILSHNAQQMLLNINGTEHGSFVDIIPVVTRREMPTTADYGFFLCHIKDVGWVAINSDGVFCPNDNRTPKVFASEPTVSEADGSTVVVFQEGGNSVVVTYNDRAILSGAPFTIV